MEQWLAEMNTTPHMWENCQLNMCQTIFGYGNICSFSPHTVQLVIWLSVSIVDILTPEIIISSISPIKSYIKPVCDQSLRGINEDAVVEFLDDS